MQFQDPPDLAYTAVPLAGHPGSARDSLQAHFDMSALSGRHHASDEEISEAVLANGKVADEFARDCSVPYRRKYTERQRTSQACKKCRSLKRKCSGDRPKCQNCQGYGFDCQYSDTYRGKRVRDEHSEAEEHSPKHSVVTKVVQTLPQALSGLEAFLRRVQPQLTEDSQREADHYARALADLSSRQSTPGPVALMPVPVKDSLPGTIAEDGLELPPLKIRPCGVLDRSSDLAFVKFVNDQAAANSGSKTSQNAAYFLDEQEIAKPHFQSVEDLFRYPSREEADKLLNAYFSTLHIAYPFLCERWVRQTLYKVYDGFTLWSDLDRQTLSMMNFLFALGSYWCNWPFDDHCMYFARGRQLFFDIFKNSTIELVQCQMLACFYLLIINKPARSWNVLGLVVRSCQNLGLVTDTESAASTAVDLEMNRRLWYSAYVLEHLIALQLGRQPNMRDEDFLVSLPMQVSDWRYLDDGTIDKKPHERDAAMPYFNALIAFSKIIGIAQRELFFLNKPSMTWERTIEVIAHIDSRLTAWKTSLSQELDFELPSSFETMTALRRQRNFFAMKYHNLRSIIHRPHITLAIMRHSKSSSRDVYANRIQQDICLNEARETIRLLDHVESERTLQWDFPLWQLIPCLMSAATILVVGAKLVTDDVERTAGINADVAICLGIFDSLQKNSAAQKCAALIRSLMTLHLRDIAPPATRAPTTTNSPTSSVEQPYDQNFALDLDYLTNLDMQITSGGIQAGGTGEAMFDWGENNLFGYGESK